MNAVRIIALTILSVLPASAQEILLGQGTPVRDTDFMVRVDQLLDAAGHEYEASFSYVGATNAKRLNDLGDVTEINSSIYYATTFPVAKNASIRTGVAWDRFSFGLPAAPAFISNTLQSVALVLGSDLQLSEKWLIRAELQPGIYSDFEDITFDDVNCLFILGGTYIVNPDLQWFFGVSVDPRRKLPVFPGVGVRWKFHRQWTLMALFPKPRIEYAPTEQWTLFVGGEAKGGTFTVSENFGTMNGVPSLNNDPVEYVEFRTGAGVSYKFSRALTAEIEGGYVPYRKWDYARAGESIKAEGAPYVQISVTGRF
ncbi:MAG: hypothetical protein OHK005_08440 [Candidatus Methylacidiphilales bacterium]